LKEFIDGNRNFAGGYFVIIVCVVARFALVKMAERAKERNAIILLLVVVPLLFSEMIFVLT
jgi:hypothetical protein